ncbi:hypothetical protein AMTR_s00005p00241660, partial [Amborella trichopoda]
MQTPSQTLELGFLALPTEEYGPIFKVFFCMPVVWPPTQPLEISVKFGTYLYKISISPQEAKICMPLAVIVDHNFPSYSRGLQLSRIDCNSLQMLQFSHEEVWKRDHPRIAMSPICVPHLLTSKLRGFLSPSSRKSAFTNSGYSLMSTMSLLEKLQLQIHL